MNLMTDFTEIIGCVVRVAFQFWCGERILNKGLIYMTNWDSKQRNSMSELIICKIYHLWAVLVIGHLWFNPPLALSIDRLYGSDPTVQQQLTIVAGMEVWNFMFEWGKGKNTRDTLMLLHHALAAHIVYMSIYPPFLLYYAGFFYGCTSITTLVLNIFTLFRVFPELKNPSNYPRVYKTVKYTFGLMFIIIRGFWWTYVSIGWYNDTVPLLFDVKCHSQLMTLQSIAITTIVTGLQYIWCYRIIQLALK